MKQFRHIDEVLAHLRNAYEDMSARHNTLREAIEGIAWDCSYPMDHGTTYEIELRGERLAMDVFDLDNFNKVYADIWLTCDDGMHEYELGKFNGGQ